MKTLKNGAIVLREIGHVALCFWAEHTREPFVIWLVDDDGNASSGRYYDDLTAASTYMDTVRE